MDQAQSGMETEFHGHYLTDVISLNPSRKKADDEQEDVFYHRSELRLGTRHRNVGGGSRPYGRRDSARSEAAAELVGGRIHTVTLDVTNIEAIPGVVNAAEAKFGPVDVLINNAGYGHEGLLEESPLEEMRRQFEVNVFGAVAVAKAFLPRFRERRRGFIVNVTSMAGLITLPGIAYYCGSKFALQGISEGMRAEMAPFGVHVTALCPGPFRTDWAGRSMVRSDRVIADYDELFDPIRERPPGKERQAAGGPGQAGRCCLEAG